MGRRKATDNLIVWNQAQSRSDEEDEEDDDNECDSEGEGEQRSHHDHDETQCQEDADMDAFIGVEYPDDVADQRDGDGFGILGDGFDRMADNGMADDEMHRYDAESDPKDLADLFDEVST